ncbi:MAG: M42 family metallopeptidase [Candidatus Diapherotrites archaeon]
MELLMKLMDAHGVSGDEDEVRTIIEKEIKKYVDEVKIDKLGNLVAKQRGTKPRIMLAAHMDEIGLMVKDIMKNGKMRFSTVGGIEPLLLVGQKVRIPTNKGTILGVITTKELNDSHEIENLPIISDLFVDTGLTQTQLIKLGIEPGNYMSPDEKPSYLGNQNIICGKALDDRIGCYVLIELAKRVKKVKNEVYYVFTAQEEVGLFGAKASAYEINPNWAVAVDATNANDCSSADYITKEIGKGPCISIKDERMISNKKVVEMLKAAAKKRDIPLQLEVSNFGTTDAMNISMTRGGVPTATLSVAIRNLHSTISIAHTQDIEDAIEVLVELLKNPPKLPVQWR